MSVRVGTLLLALCSYACSSERQTARNSAQQDVVGNTTAGPAARELSNRAGFDWVVSESEHARLHVPRGSQVSALVPSLADSVEQARRVALDLLEARDDSTEPKLELFFVDTRDDMKRLMGRPIGGFAQPGELTAAFVAGPGYKPFLRHELTHAYAAVRWGELRAGVWLTEGLAALAQGACQGHSVDALASGFLMDNRIPSLTELARDFRAVPELPGYIAAASAADFIRQRRGVVAIRALWQGLDSAQTTHPLGEGGALIEQQWRQKLRAIAPARLDSVRLVHEGC